MTTPAQPVSPTTPSVGPTTPSVGTAPTLVKTDAGSDAPELSVPTRLPSGRHVVVRVDGGVEGIEVRSPTGEVEVRIALTPEGPVVRLSGARLELDAIESVSIKSKSIELQAESKVSIASGEDVRIEAAREVWIEADDDLVARGKVIHLN